jgi:hypothetical protein
MGRAIPPDGLSPASVPGAVLSPRMEESLSFAPSLRNSRVVELQQGTRLRYRATGTLFEIKKITNQFIILRSIEGVRQIMTGKRHIAWIFD